MDQLSREDQLRLNVLIAQPLQAIRIDEAKMEVHALSEKGEARVLLHPNCRDERYLRLVRQMFSGHILGSPGGYPVYLKRWTRMGQARRESLEKLLLLGEPEAVAAVVHAPGLANELARRAWWCENSAEHARKMLSSPEVVQGDMGPVLAEFLMEFLPFEETTAAMIETVRLVLQPGLISDAMRADLWSRARRRNTYYVGFLWHPDQELPAQQSANPLREKLLLTAGLVKCRSSVLECLLRVLDENGQNFIATSLQVLKKPNDQEVVVQLFAVLRQYFGAGQSVRAYSDMQAIEEEVHRQLPAVIKQCEMLSAEFEDLDVYIEAVLFLSLLSEEQLDPVFGVTDAIGSVMRKKIEHLLLPIQRRLERLLS